MPTWSIQKELTLVARLAVACAACCLGLGALSVLDVACSSHGSSTEAETVAQSVEAVSLAASLGPLDQTSEYALVTGLSNGASVALTRNGTSLTTQTVTDFDLRFNSAGTAGFGNLNDAAHVVLQGTFTGGTQSELLFYNSADSNWRIGVSNSSTVQWTTVANIGFGNLNDGNHRWWVGDFTGASRSQVLLYNGADANWWLGRVNGTVSGLTSGSMTWTNVANTTGFGFGNLNTSTTVYVNVADFMGSGKQQVYVFNSSGGPQFLGVANAGGSSMAFGGLGRSALGSFKDGQHTIWTGNMSGGTQQQMLVYNTSTTAWNLGAINSAGTTATWTSLGNNNVGNVLTAPPPAQTWIGNFSATGQAEVLIYDGVSRWTLARMNGAALGVTFVGLSPGTEADASCTGCYFAMGNFFGSGKTEILFYAFSATSNSAFIRGTISAPLNSNSLQWTGLGAFVFQGPMRDASHYVRAGQYTMTGQTELVWYDPFGGGECAPDTSCNGDWYRASWRNGALSVNVEANTRGINSNLFDPSRDLWAGAFDAGHDEFVTYDSATGAFWLGGFDATRIRLPALLTPGDTIVATSAGNTLGTVTVANNVTTEHYNNARTGANVNETQLTPANVLGASSTFSAKSTLAFQSSAELVYPQPLFVHGVTVGGTARNMVYVATSQDWVYAFDAAATGTVQPLLKTQLVPPGEAFATSSDSGNCRNLSPSVGITGTPVIDVATGTLYAVTRTRDSSGNVHIRLHALDITTLGERANSPIEVLFGHTYDPTFSKWANQRPGLALEGGGIYIGFASFCDGGSYAGQMFSYDAHTLGKGPVFTAVPDWQPGAAIGGAGIWHAGVAPAATTLADGTASIFFATGNLTASTPGLFDDSVVRLGVAATWQQDTATRTDLNNGDADLASSGVMLLPGGAFLVGGKQGYLNVVDQTTMTLIQQVPLYTDANGQAILFNGTICSGQVNEPGNHGMGALYNAGSGSYHLLIRGGDCAYSGSPFMGHLVRFAWNASTRMLSWESGAATNFPQQSSTAVSSNGTVGGTAIAWFVDPVSMALVAYDAMHIASKPERKIVYGTWTGGTPYILPTVMDGKVYAGSKGAVTVFNL
jgi:hypothetical protein